MPDSKSIAETGAFLLGKLGELSTSRFADRLSPLGLRPRLCGVLGVLAHSPGAQMTLAGRLHVSPSVIVDMIDELEELGAVRRVRDTQDRRKQLVELTPRGRKLAARSTALAVEIDTELMTGLSPEEREVLIGTLRQLAVTHGILSGGDAQG